MTTGSMHLWHPFADMSKVRGNEFRLARGEGAWVWDDEGNRYLDATAALWYCNIGHGRARMGEVASAQMTELAAYQIFERLANAPALELADKLAELSGLGEQTGVFFTSGGSDGVETAAKIVRRYWRVREVPERSVIIARESAYHGMHGYGTSLSGIEANAAGWGEMIPSIVHVPRDDVAALERALDEHRGRVAAFLSEPIQGAGGVYPPKPGYWRDVQDLCSADDVLVVADEVVTGFGRVGAWFASHRLEIEPDLMITAKGLSSGYMPIGAVIAGPRILETLWSEDAGWFRHGYTYSGHPAACAVALENLAVLEEEDLVARVAGLEEPFGAIFAAVEDHPAVAEVRHFGLLGAVQLTEDVLEAGGLDATVAALRDAGILTRGLVGHSLQFSPSFVITEEEIAMLGERLAAALTAAN